MSNVDNTSAKEPNLEIRLEFILYLPFLLRRHRSDWGSRAIRYVVGEFRLAILVLPQSEATKAPRSPDGLTATRTPTEMEPNINTWQVVQTPHTNFYEAMVIAVFGDVKSASDVLDNSVRAKFLNAAIAGARRFLTFCRALAEDTLIHFIGQEVTPENLHFAGFPYCESWWHALTQERLGDDKINCCYGEFLTGRSGVKPVPWQEVRKAVESGSEPRPDVLAMLDAESASLNVEDSKAVFMAAISIEVAVKTFLQNTSFDKQILKTLENCLEVSFAGEIFPLTYEAGKPALT